MTDETLPEYIKFTKMHGLGNDFMVIDSITQDFEPSVLQIQTWADRNFGIGFDQLLLVEPPGSPDIDFRYRIFNSDGSEVEHCGNGARCFARFVRDKGLTHKDVIRVSVAKGVIELALQEDGQIAVDMGTPLLAPKDIPYIAESEAKTYMLDLDGTSEKLEISLVSMGNPHAVLLVKDIDAAPVRTLGPLIQGHPNFPEECNVGFMQIHSKSEVSLRVFERGVGETLACGTGACAAVVAGRLRGLLDAKVQVKLPGGLLDISWANNNSVIMTGPATTVFEGQIEWNKLPN